MSYERIEKWTDWMKRPVKNGVLTLHHRRQIWRELRDIVKERDLPDPAFWQYHLDLYATTQAVAVRRQTARSERRPPLRAAGDIG